MKNAYVFIGILFLTIGFAAISTTLNIGGGSSLLTNLDDFGIYYSDAYVNSEQNLSIVESDTVISFNPVLWQVGESYTVEYEVTNGSDNYDANVDVVCTGGNDYFTMTNTFDSSTTLNAKESRKGTVTITMNQWYSNESAVVYECVINGEAVSRDEIAEGEASTPATEQNYPGKEIEITTPDGEEKFFYLSEDDETVTIFAQNNLCSDYRQCENGDSVNFSNAAGWEAGTDVDIQQHDGPVKEYINNYIAYLKEVTGIDEISGTLITIEQMVALGCESSQFGDTNNTCNNSKHKDWIVNGNSFWTRTSYAEQDDKIWRMNNDGYSNFEYFGSMYGVRPVITLPKALLKYL